MEHIDMSYLLSLIWKTALQAAVLALVVLVVSRLAKNAPARLRYGLWVVALVKFLVPPFVLIPSEMAVWRVEPAPLRESFSTPTFASAHGYGPAAAPEPVDTGPSAVSETMPIQETSIRPTIALPDAATLGMLGWLVGACISMFILIARCRRQSRLLAGSSEAERPLIEALAAAAASLRVRRLPRLRMSQAVSTPTLVGLFRPVILLPESVSTSCSSRDVDAMLLHELAHVKRADLAVVWLYRFVQILFFFHPALWLIGREMERERELACDELVVASSAISPTEYAAGYVSALKLAQTRRPESVSVSVGMAEPFDVGKKRLQAMLRGALPKLSPGWVTGLLIVAAIGLPTFAGVRQRLAAVTFTREPSSIRPSAGKQAPLSGQERLKWLVNGTHKAASGIVSGRGTAIVRSWYITSNANPKGPVFETEDVYKVAFAGERMRVSLRTTLLKNETKAGPGIIPNKPGYKGSREILIDGKTVTNLVEYFVDNVGKEHPAPRATVGSGASFPGEGGGFAILPGKTPFRLPTADIELTGRQLPGNGILDLTTLRFRGQHKENILRLAGTEVIDGDMCHIVELIAPGLTSKIPKFIVRVWVDPSKGFAMPRIRVYRDDGRRRVMVEEANTLLRRYGHGVWGPAKVVQNNFEFSRGRRYKNRSKVISYNPFQLNVPIRPEELALELPPGTNVYDEKTDSFYFVQENGEWRLERQRGRPPAPQKEFAGVGITVDADRKTGELKVLSVMANSPAQKEGLLPGDVIVEVDGKPVAKMGIQDAVGRIRGKAGAAVRITIRRPNVTKLLEFEIIRSELQYSSDLIELIKMRTRENSQRIRSLRGKVIVSSWSRYEDGKQVSYKREVTVTADGNKMRSSSKLLEGFAIGDYDASFDGDKHTEWIRAEHFNPPVRIYKGFTGGVSHTDYALWLNPASVGNTDVSNRTFTIQGREILNGDECLVTVSTSPYGDGYTSTSRVWINTRKGYTIAKSEETVTKIDSVRLMPNQVNTTEMKYYGRNLWVPIRHTITQYGEDGSKVMEMSASYVGFRYNLPVPAKDLELTLPSGILVHDSISGKTYHAP